MNQDNRPSTSQLSMPELGKVLQERAPKPSFDNPWVKPVRSNVESEKVEQSTSALKTTQPVEPLSPLFEGELGGQTHHLSQLLQQAQSRLDLQNQELNRQAEVLRNREIKIEARFKALRLSLQQAHETLAQEKAQLQQRLDVVQAKEAALNQQNSDENRFEAESKSLKAQLAVLQGTLAQEEGQRRQFEQVLAENQSLRQQLTELRNQRQADSQTTVTLKESAEMIQTLQEKVSVLSAQTEEMSDTKRDLAGLQQSIDSLKEENSRLKEQVDGAGSSKLAIPDLTETNSQLQESNLRLQGELESLHAEVADIKSEAQTDASLSQEENQRLQEQIRRLQEELIVKEEEQSQLAALTLENESLQQTVSRLKKVNDEALTDSSGLLQLKEESQSFPLPEDKPQETVLTQLEEENQGLREQLSKLQQLETEAGERLKAQDQQYSQSQSALELHNIDLQCQVAELQSWKQEAEKKPKEQHQVDPVSDPSDPLLNLSDPEINLDNTSLKPNNNVESELANRSESDSGPEKNQSSDPWDMDDEPGLQFINNLQQPPKQKTSRRAIILVGVFIVLVGIVFILDPGGFVFGPDGGGAGKPNRVEGPIESTPALQGGEPVSKPTDAASVPLAEAAGPTGEHAAGSMLAADFPSNSAGPSSAETIAVRAEKASREQAELELVRAREEALLFEQEQAKIRELLSLAQANISVDRLSRPAGDNAMEKYQQILDFDPENLEAIAGVERVVQRYVALAKAALGQGQLNRADQLLAKASGIDPDLTVIKELRVEWEKAKIKKK
ncbi:MAG: hypothetical protein HQL67_00780 [Magnetococcales bacterium]|nr:hypothetical protein [Magnetococcales bacterium]